MRTIVVFDRNRCTLCGDCLVKCKYMEFTEEEAKEEMRKLVEGEPSRVTSGCITCVSCNLFCPYGANPFDLINQRQEETGTFNANPKGIEMMEMAHLLPTEVIKGEPGKPAITLCSMDIIPSIIEGRLFDGLTILKGGDYFCTIGWLHVGYPSKVKEGAQAFVDKLAESGAKEIICYHDDCYAMLTREVKEYGIDPPFKPVHIIEYLRDYVREHQDEVKKLDMKIAYQWPCASNYTPEKDVVLDELFELIGVERVPRKYDRMDALCCGMGMGLKSNIPKERKDEIKEKNIGDAKKAGAEAMVFLCPLCLINLAKMARQAGIEPYMLSNLVRLALGEELSHSGSGSIEMLEQVFKENLQM